MGLISEKSTIKFITSDDYTISHDFDTREEAIKVLLTYTNKFKYKQASIFDFNVGSEVLSFRTVK